MENETKNGQNDGAANADVHTAYLKPAPATFVTPILDILALAARCPSHLLLPLGRSQRWGYIFRIFSAHTYTKHRVAIADF